MTPDEAQAAVRVLFAKLMAQTPTMNHADLYYSGLQPISFLAPEIRAQVGTRITSLVVNWPRVIVDSVLRRSRPEGFRLGRGGEADDELRGIWQRNDLDEWSAMGRADSLVLARSFLSVGPNDEDPTTPRVMVESPRQMVVEHSPGTRRVRLALKVWRDGSTAYATLYEPEGRWRFAAEAASTFSDTGTISTEQSWRLVPGDEFTPSGLGVVPIVPLPNRPRVLNLDGESELTDVMPLADAINKLATDMMVSAEYHAMPRRWATGIEIPSGDNRERLQAEVAAYWDKATKGKTWLAGKDVSFGQFNEASLSNFVEGIKLLTSQVAAIGGLPPDDLGLATTNPASAEARRAADAVLVGRAEEKHLGWGGAYERAMQMAVCLRDDIAFVDLPAEFRSMETIWRDPNTPAISQTMDAAQKGLDAGIYDDVQAREVVGLTPTQSDAIDARTAEKAALSATSSVRAQLDLAAELERDQGFTKNAALAAVGLLQAASLNT